MRTGSIDVGLIVCSNNVLLPYDNGINVTCEIGLYFTLIRKL